MRHLVKILDHWSSQVLEMEQPVDQFISAGLLYIFMMFASFPILLLYYLYDPLLWRSLSIWLLANALISKEYLIWRGFVYTTTDNVAISRLLFMKVMSIMIFGMMIISSLLLVVYNKPNIYVLLFISLFSTMYITTGKVVKIYRDK